MEKAEWDECTDPKPMIRHLIGEPNARVQDLHAFPNCIASHRKLRLFAIACYYRICHALDSPVNSTLVAPAVRIAEQYAEGTVLGRELKEVELMIWEELARLEPAWRASEGDERIALHPGHIALGMACQITDPHASKAACYASSNAYLSYPYLVHPGVSSHHPEVRAIERAEKEVQSEMLRCICGNLFSPDGIGTDLLRWREGTIPKMAEDIYTRLDFASMPILADALEDAGCTEPDILSHCRGHSKHVRGCWVLDLILGRE